MVETFDVTETTVRDVHRAMRAGDLTCEALVERYLERIETYDRDGPALNGVVSVNPRAEDRARELDEAFRADGLTGPLHGVPVLVKDQAQTADVPTTFGSEAFEGYVPETDATIVTRLRDAGAVILAKTNLPDWAAGFVGYSSVAGQTKNPYALDRDPGGSSAGTGAGVAANLGLVGIGEDTGGSIRVPSSCCNLYGLRVTTGLVSRSGLSPLVARQDTAGPMTRTVEDLARVLDAIVGVDADDPWTGACATDAAAGGDDAYRSHVDPDGLEGARIGVLRDAFGDETDRRGDEVSAVVEDALSTMAAAGAELVDPVSLPDLDEWTDRTSLYEYQSKRDLDAFLGSLPDPPAASVDELYRRGAYHEALELFETIAGAPDDPGEAPGYWRAVADQSAFRRELVALLAEHDLDALAFPDVRSPPVPYEAYHEGRVTRSDYVVNTVLASQSGCPAMTVPGGFTDDGLPVGVELLGAPHAERRLVELAAGYERAADARRPPESAPPLAD